MFLVIATVGMFALLARGPREAPRLEPVLVALPAGLLGFALLGAYLPLAVLYIGYVLAALLCIGLALAAVFALLAAA